jgi:hypothetical protein
MTLTSQQGGGKPPLTVTVQTEGKVKALHAIAKKEIAEHLKHMTASVDYLYNATQDWLGKLHSVAVSYPNLGISKMQSLPLEVERLGDGTFQLPFANPKPIDVPNFPFPTNSYIWVEYIQTFYLVGLIPANGEPVVGVLDVLAKPSLLNPTALISLVRGPQACMRGFPARNRSGTAAWRHRGDTRALCSAEIMREVNDLHPTGAALRRQRPWAWVLVRGRPGREGWCRDFREPPRKPKPFLTFLGGV